MANDDIVAGLGLLHIDCRLLHLFQDLGKLSGKTLKCAKAGQLYLVVRLVLDYLQHPGVTCPHKRSARIHRGT